MESKDLSGNHESGLQVGQNQGPINAQFCTSVSTTDATDRLCMRALRCPDPLAVKNRLKESRDKLLRQSFEWILRDPQYRSWQDGDESSLLWLKGGAGKGKTMISIGIIEELSRIQHESTVAYFFCQAADYELNTLEAIIKGLILQLVNQQTTVRQCLRRRWDTINGRFEGDITSWRTLWEILLEMLQYCESRKVYIIVDGLDECQCQSDDMADFLRLLVRLVTKLESPARIKWMLTSRPLAIVERELLAGRDQSQHEISLELNSVHIYEGVRAYVAQKVAELGTSNSHLYFAALSEELEDKLTEKAEGSFFWVTTASRRLLFAQTIDEAMNSIQVENLRLSTRRFYGRLWSKLNDSEPGDVRKYVQLLRAMLMAARPLKIEEFPNVDGLNSNDELFHALINGCASFVKVNGAHFEFVHQCVRDFLAGVILSDQSADKHHNQSLEESETRSQALSEEYPTSKTAITATEESSLPQSCWSVEDGQETVGTSTNATSLSQENQGHDADDNGSIYTSDVPHSSTYVREIATSFFEGSERPDADSLERIHKGLSDLLRGFAQRIGGENQASNYLEAMRFIHKKRAEISTHFKQCYVDDTEISHRTKLNDMSPEELFSMWHVDQEMDDPYSLTVMPDDVPRIEDDSPLSSEDDDDDDDDDYNCDNAVGDSQVKLYRDIVTNSAAFQWLLCRVQRETELTTSEATVMNGISTQIRQSLYSRRENRLISSKTGPPKCSVIFQSDWDPLAFVREQEYKEAAEEAIEYAIVLVQGANDDTEAVPCGVYVDRTWPLFGQHFMGLVRNTVCSEPGLRSSVTLFDSTKITAWVERSGCFSMEAVGVAETIVEVGEVYTFITAALRSAQGASIAFVNPTLHEDANARKAHQAFRVSFHLETPDKRSRSTGQCWQGLFRNPAVVLGFPVRRRQPDQEAGLEISIATLAGLVRTQRITVFCGNSLLKGFCTVLVPTKYTRDTVHWHVLFNEDGSRISLTDPRVRDVAKKFDLSKYLTLSGVETARHIVGWHENVRNYAGTKEGSFNINKTRLPRPTSSFAFDRVSISAGKGITVGVSGAFGKKDKPVRAAKMTDYHKQIGWVYDKFIVLYDCKDRRAWLIDGPSGMLHLVRAHLAHCRKIGREVLFSEDGIKEPESPYEGKRAAMAVLQNRANMNLKIYERWSRIIEETSQKGQDSPETSQKTERSWEQLPDLVGDIYGILSMLFDVQADKSTEDGFGAKVRRSPRRHLEGWDFQHVAISAISGDPLLPKVASLHDIGLGWVDLIRAIDAVVLFGVGFGEILEPIDTTGVLPLDRDDTANTSELGPALRPTHNETRCARWASLPKGKDLLATTTPVIRDIMEQKADDKEDSRQLFTGIYWHSPDKVFEDCQCATVSEEETQCDRVQVLLPTNFPKLFARGVRNPLERLPDFGAVIFGHSMKFPLIWKSEPNSVPTEESPESSQVESQSPPERNSGFRASFRSLSVRGYSTSRGSSVQPSASSRSTPAGDSSSVTSSITPATGSDATSTSSRPKGGKSFVKRLFKSKGEASRNPTRS